MIKENTKIGITILLLAAGLGFSALFIAFFSEIAEEALSEETWTFDSAIIAFFNLIESSGLDVFMIAITELGSVWFVTAFSMAVVGFLWFKERDKLGILFFLIAVGGGAVLTLLLKSLYARERPSINPAIDAIGFSFPSGHSMGSVIFYGFVMYLVLRSGKSKVFKGIAISLLGMLIALIGISRIYLSAHYPSDVLAGFTAGAIWLTLSILALEWIQWQSMSGVRPVHEIRNFLAKILNAVKEKSNFIK